MPMGSFGWGENGKRRQGLRVPLQLRDKPRPPERPGRMRMGMGMGQAAAGAARAGR